MLIKGIQLPDSNTCRDTGVFLLQKLCPKSAYRESKMVTGIDS